ncbi:MAG TPA: PCRF domain-containing protein, partial [Burkholderiales bacterium]|nr:PCRF domain-containing protein [Burkholderiales bacterium]
MSAIPSDKLDKVVQRWEEIQADLNRGVKPATYAQLTKEFADLQPIVETVQELRKLEAERRDLMQLMHDPASEKGLKDLAQEEFDQVDL